MNNKIAEAKPKYAIPSAKADNLDCKGVSSSSWPKDIIILPCIEFGPTAVTIALPLPDNNFEPEISIGSPISLKAPISMVASSSSSKDA
ncbi:unnamed protein product [[Candida] boidinii]|nr:unnamed protein product [[Candida] boidinii]